MTTVPPDPAAAFALYHAHARGRGVPRDVARAMAFLRDSAAAGHAPAQVALGHEIYGEDKDAALASFLAAAAQGDAEGQLAAGRMIFFGRFTARDEARGLALLAAAAAHGGDDAVREHADAVRRVEARGRSDRANLAIALAEHGVAAHEAAVVAAALPSVRLVATGEVELAIGASKLGGAPDLPAGHVWPRRGDRRLAFVAQLDLADLARHHDDPLLPRDGVLVFFYDADEQPWGAAAEADGWAVEHHVGPLVRAASSRFPVCGLAAFAELTVPTPRSAAARALDLDAYRDAAATYQDIHRRPPTGDGDVHRLLGHPDAIQGDMTRRLEYGWRGADLDQPTPELEAAARTWRLLLQIDSEHRAGMMWGDLGRLFVWIREDDLRHRRFGAARLQLQCS